MGSSPRDYGPVGNSWALLLSGGELSPVGSCPRTAHCNLNRQVTISNYSQLCLCQIHWD